MNKEGVLVVGSANMDLVVFTKNFPKPGETVFGNKFQMFPGGKGANQAVACSRLGCKTYFMGKVGEDDFGLSLIDSMTNDNIDLSYLIRSSEVSTGMAMITVDSKGENEIVVVSGANMDFKASDIKSFSENFTKVKIAMTQLEIPLETVIETALIARASECIFILNPAPAKELPLKLLPYIDFITPNENELEKLTGIKSYSLKDIKRSAKILISQGIKNVIVTLGEKGSLFVNDCSEKLYPTNPVQAVDSTAAGDTFNGAFACALAMNKEIDDAIKFANYSAAISVTRMGAQISMPSMEEVEQILKD